MTDIREAATEMIKILLTLAIFSVPASAEFTPFGSPPADVPPINFCAQGRLLIFTGSCDPGPGTKKDSISRPACAQVAGVLNDVLPVLYPNAQIENYSDLTADGVMEKLMRPLVLGFFFVGEGDVRGGFITGPKRERVYPDPGACTSNYDLFAGFTSHSKYSPSVAAPEKLRGRVLSRTQTLYSAAGAMLDSWPKLCKPRISLVYPTRTFSGRMESDALKFAGLLQEEKKKHVLGVLNTICDNCPGHVAAGDALAGFCPPNSDVCKLRQITPGSEEFVLKNYCRALGPVPAPAGQ
jgi:hypothetical protein